MDRGLDRVTAASFVDPDSKRERRSWSGVGGGVSTPSREFAMASPADDLESAALALPAEARAKLAERLLASLAEDREVEEVWAEEIRRRLEAYRNGQIESVPARQVIEELRARLGR